MVGIFLLHFLRNSHWKQELRERRKGNESIPLLAQIQLLENRLVTLGRGILEVIKKTAARGNHLEKAATGGVILGVAFQVFGKIRDPLGEGGYLDIGAAGVLLMQPECCDFCCFCCRHVFEDWDTSLIPAI